MRRKDRRSRRTADPVCLSICTAGTWCVERRGEASWCTAWVVEVFIRMDVCGKCACKHSVTPACSVELAPVGSVAFMHRVDNVTNVSRDLLFVHDALRSQWSHLGGFQPTHTDTVTNTHVQRGALCFGGR